MESLSKIALLTICNDKFTDICAVMIYSFLLNNKWFNGDIIICCDTNKVLLNPTNREKLLLLYSKIIFREVNIDEYRDFVAYYTGHVQNRYLPSAYTFEVFDLEEYDKVVYLDADIIIRDSIEELFHLESKIAGVKWGKNFNFGVLAVTPCEETKIKKQLLEFSLTLNPDKMFAFEEDVFNEYIFKNHLPVLKLSEIYNYVNYRIFNKEAKVFHYLVVKPWLLNNVEYLSKFNHEWFKYKRNLKLAFGSFKSTFPLGTGWSRNVH